MAPLIPLLKKYVVGELISYVGKKLKKEIEKEEPKPTMLPADHLKYQLETLSTFEPSDLDYPEFEVGYESESGSEGFTSVCCVDLAERALDRIQKLEVALQAYAKYGNKFAMERDIRLLNNTGIEHGK